MFQAKGKRASLRSASAVFEKLDSLSSAMPAKLLDRGY